MASYEQTQDPLAGLRCLSNRVSCPEKMRIESVSSIASA